MKTPFLRLVTGGVGVIILLAACAPPATSMPEPAPVVTQASQAIDQPEPDKQVELPALDLSSLELGSWMYWFDDVIMLYIPEGEFIMGSQQFDDNPPQRVTLGGYWIYRNPVTNDMYRKCVVAGACDPPATEPPYDDSFDPDRKDYPVVGVNWEQAQDYCAWMSGDLPSEAQWEKAARGPDGNKYPWGEDDPDCTLLNFKDCVGDTTPVQAYYPQGMSYYELFDTAGNTFEWTRDWYQDDYYTSAPGTDPFGPEEGSFRPVRGSGFESELDLLPLAHRAFLQPEKYRIDLGFRCVVTEPANYAPFCNQTAYIPGENKGPGKPPPGGPDQILHQPPDCEYKEAPNATVGRYCVNQTNQTGGATVTITGNLQSISGAGVNCDNSNPVGCWGPENASFDVVVCVECIGWMPPDSQSPSCDPGYTLMGDQCVFQGIPAIPATTCPSGWFLDLDGYCKPFLMLSDPECPKGYQYDQVAECCTATFIEPSGGWAGVPPNSYSSCPVGYDYYTPTGICWFGGGAVTGQYCDQFTHQLGECRDNPPDSGCTNPGQYGNQSSCEAAGCKWNQPATGAGGGYCSSP